ncbi:MAG TPA: zinc ribbon domain-containing protein [Candidatus Faecousia intestinigallinarum]|nr:zinc ribbon domain-containing protein [Candidatus Faecousia intestinigallinarum]
MRSKTSVPSGSLDSLLSQFNSDQAGQSHSPLETSQISPEQGSSITEPAQSIAMSADETARREPGSTPKSRAHNKRYRSSPEDTIHTSLYMDAELYDKLRWLVYLKRCTMSSLIAQAAKDMVYASYRCRDCGSTFVMSSNRRAATSPQEARHCPNCGGAHIVQEHWKK